MGSDSPAEGGDDVEAVWRADCAPGRYTLSVDDILIAPSILPREHREQGRFGRAGGAVDWALVRRYRKEMRAGAEFPPVLIGAMRAQTAARNVGVFDALRGQSRDAKRWVQAVLGRSGDKVLVLLDGAHRVEARREITNTVDAVVVEVRDFDHARWLALAANLTHGRALKAKEKRTAFTLYVKARQHLDNRGHVKSLRAMGGELGLSHMTIKRRLVAEFPAAWARLKREAGLDDDEADPAPPSPRDFDRERVAAAVGHVRAALATALKIDDAERLSEVVAALREALAAVEIGEADVDAELGDLSAFTAGGEP